MRELRRANDEWFGWLPCAIVLAAAASVCVRDVGAASGKRPAVLRAFEARLPAIWRQVPLVTKAAAAAADRLIAHPRALLNVPYAEQPTFAEEILNRAGGLALPLPPCERPREVTEHDILLFSVRSWERDGARAGALLSESRNKGWLSVLFASKAGMPKEIEVDFVIDNGASSGAAAEAPLNSIVNILNAWLWQCEYVAALSRRGKCPGVLMSVLLPEAQRHNSALQTREGRHWMSDCATSIEPGKLARLYLQRVDRLRSDLGGDPIQAQVKQAARVIRRRLAAGGKVCVASCSHFLMGEVFLDNKSAWQPLHVVWSAKTAFATNLEKGDLLVWFGYVGMSTPFEDYGGAIRRTGAEFVTSFVPDPNPANNAPDALCHIAQSWEIGDAEVPIPFPPGRMAPVSGVNQGLLYRILDEEVASAR